MKPILLRKAVSNVAQLIGIALFSASCAAFAHPIHGFVGLNCAAWDLGLDSPKVVSLLKAAGVTALRWPGGSGADNYDWTNPPKWQTPTSRFADLAAKIGADVTITANYGTGTPQMAAAWVAYCNSNPTSAVKIGTDSTGRDWRTAGYWATLRASKPLDHDDGFNFLRLGKIISLRFENWEIGNECYGNWEADDHVPAHDPAVYAEFAVEAAQLMRKVDPSIRIGVVVTGSDRPYQCQEEVIDPINQQPTSEWTPLVLSGIANHGFHPDFVSYHYYPQDSGQESDAFLFAAPSHLPKIAKDLRTLLNYYFPTKSGKAVGIACTECNSVAFNPGPQTSGVANAIFYSETAREMQSLGFVNLIWWGLHNGPNTTGFDTHSKLNRYPFGDYGVLGRDSLQDKPYPVYNAIKKFADAHGLG